MTWITTCGYERYDWKLNVDSIPNPNLGEDPARDAIRNGVQNVISVNGGACNWADNVDAAAGYQGDTNAVADISYQSVGGELESTCLGNDGLSAVSFGDRQPGVLATTCTYTHSGATPQQLRRGHESDVEVDRDRPWSTIIGDDCSGTWDLESVMTHEFGHTFGLDHFSKKYLTMSPYIPACGTTNRTLELGDVSGLRARY